MIMKILNFIFAKDFKPEFKIEMNKSYDGKFRYDLRKRDPSFKSITSYDYLGSYNTLEEAENMMRVLEEFPRYYDRNGKRVA